MGRAVDHPAAPGGSAAIAAASTARRARSTCVGWITRVTAARAAGMTA